MKGILEKCRQEVQAARQLSAAKGDGWGHLPAPGGGPRSGSKQEKGLLFLECSCPGRQILLRLEDTLAKSL